MRLFSRVLPAILVFLLPLSVIGLPGGKNGVVFSNRIGTEVNAPVSRPDGSGAGEGAQAQLLLVHSDGSIQLLFPTTTFRTTSAAAAYYVNLVDVLVAPEFQTVTLRMRAWIGESYENAAMRGESNDISVTMPSISHRLKAD